MCKKTSQVVHPILHDLLPEDMKEKTLPFLGYHNYISAVCRVEKETVCKSNACTNPDQKNCSKCDVRKQVSCERVCRTSNVWGGYKEDKWGKPIPSADWNFTKACNRQLCEGDMGTLLCTEVARMA